ncbi:MAG: hypothetical protein COA75_14220 [Cellvibrionales bacterium]|nr:MAG: hypothetical protein COA75_14220 [Cellvibrionales bacterium]
MIKVINGALPFNSHLLSRVSPDSGTSTYNHDGAGNRTATTDAKGQVFTLSYDARNRPTFADAPGTAHDIQYTYDTCANGVNKLCRLTRGANTTQYAYNGFGDVLSIDQDVQRAWRSWMCCNNYK